MLKTKRFWLVSFVVLGLVLSTMALLVSAEEESNYTKNYEDLEAALISKIAWYGEARESSEALYEISASVIEETKVRQIIEVRKTESPEYITQIVKGLNKTGDLIELRVRNYKNIEKIEALCLYKDELQAYVEEEYIEHELRLKFENYENPDLSFTIEVMPYDLSAPLTLDAPIIVVLAEKGVEIEDIVTLKEAKPKIINRIIDEIAPTGWVPIAALNPFMLGAILPKDAAEKFLDSYPTSKASFWKWSLSIVGSVLFNCASDGGAGYATGAAFCLNAASLID